LNQILKRQTSRSHYGSKAPAVTITVFKNRNKIGKIVVKTVPYSMNVNVKNFFTSHIDKKKKKKKERKAKRNTGYGTELKRYYLSIYYTLHVTIPHFYQSMAF
jgi:hypothetical protein